MSGEGPFTVSRSRSLTPYKAEPTTQREAIREAVGEAKVRPSEVMIHRADGRIRDSDSYGSDPEVVRDSKQ